MSQQFAPPANENVPLPSCDHQKQNMLQETLSSAKPIKQYVKTLVTTKLADKLQEKFPKCQRGVGKSYQN